MQLQITGFMDEYNSFARENNLSSMQAHTVIDAIRSPSTNFEWQTFTGSDVQFFDDSFDEMNSLNYLSFDKSNQITGE